MNISEIKVDYSKYEGKNLLSVIFDKQRTLIDLYDVPSVDLDVPKDQQVLRVLAWSVIEEAAEAIDVIKTTNDPEHLRDEVADLTHFFIELLILSGFTYKDFESELPVPRKQESVEQTFTDFSVQLALAINVLKNRFWRKTNLKTDQNFYRTQLKLSISLFLAFVFSLNLTFDEMIDSYLRKNEINLFRIRSNY